jgi:hypothetical protein
MRNKVLRVNCSLFQNFELMSMIRPNIKDPRQIENKSASYVGNWIGGWRNSQMHLHMQISADAAENERYSLSSQIGNRQHQAALDLAKLSRNSL